MILKTKVPGRVVNRRVRKPGGGYRIKPWFRFDENGLKEIDESKLTKADLNKLTSLFEVVDDEEGIRLKAKEKGIKSWHVKSIERLKKELEV